LICLIDDPREQDPDHRRTIPQQKVPGTISHKILSKQDAHVNASHLHMAKLHYLSGIERQLYLNAIPMGVTAKHFLPIKTNSRLNEKNYNAERLVRVIVCIRSMDFLF